MAKININIVYPLKNRRAPKSGVAHPPKGGDQNHEDCFATFIFWTYFRLCYYCQYDRGDRGLPGRIIQADVEGDYKQVSS